jgi:hypothetical protein
MERGGEGEGGGRRYNWGNFSSETIQHMYVTFKWVLMFSWAIFVIRKLVKTFQGTVWELAL